MLDRQSCLGVRYSALISEVDSNSDIERDENWQRRLRCQKGILFLLILIVSLLSLIGGFMIRIYLEGRKISVYSQNLPSRMCESVSTRREWRSLSTVEKKEYIDGVQCLRDTPSMLGLNQSLYDDFPWVHSRIGESSHGAAAFLSWHRYFIHIYEKALQEQCHYRGNLAYWDWVLDWEDITRSPVWSCELGFGGNGNASVGKSILEGHCVVDGPFAMLEVTYLDSRLEPHCLSRGFESGKTLAELGQGLRPQVLEDLMNVAGYESFSLGLENGPHVAIPRSIRGDFSLFTAPYDPVFFLHHTQLDRLWWTWQQREPQARKMQYEGLAASKLTVNASLHDLISVGHLAPDIEVLNIIDSESAPLCYRY